MEVRKKLFIAVSFILVFRLNSQTSPALAYAVAPSTPPVFVPNSKQQAKYLKSANKNFNEKLFADAIIDYEKALEGDEKNKTILTNLCECYRLTNNVKGQLKCYDALLNLENPDPIYNLYYGEALMENGEREKAKTYFEKYNSDARGKELASSINKLKSYSRNADAYSVNEVSFNSSEDDFCAVKFFDNVVFSSNRKRNAWIKREHGWTNGNYLQSYSTSKVDGIFATPKIFMGDLKSKYNDGPISFTKDFNMVYFTRNSSKKNEVAPDGTYKLEILEATLDANGFSFVKILPFNNHSYNSAHPSISTDGTTLYFASDMPGGKGGMDIYVCTKDSLGNWGQAQNLGEPVNTAGHEVFPFIAANGMFYFSSNGHDGLGGLDIYEAKLKEGKVTKIYDMGEPVNSKDDDFGIYLLEDSKNGFISSNRKMGGMDDDIYTLQILRDVKRGKDVKLLVKDKESGEALDSVKIIINEKDTIVTNEKGEFMTSMEEGVNNKYETIKTDYFNSKDSANADNLPDENAVKEIVMNKDPKLFLRALITDGKTGELLEGVTIKLTDIAANSEMDTYVTKSSGDYFKSLFGKKMGDKLTFLVSIEKPGYLQRTLIFSHTIDKPGEINMNKTLNLTLGKVEVGVDIGKMIDLKPIHFDFGKSKIRKDAARELDKIIQVMNEYPNMCIELGSHTDCRNSAKANMKLSAARAKASMEYIVKKGIGKLRITSKGYGESRLLNNCACEGKSKSKCPEEEHAKNRRVEFVITRLK